MLVLFLLLLRFDVSSQPKLTPDAADFIADAYSTLRSREHDDKTLPVTARTLETMIRLATAHSKVRISFACRLGLCWCCLGFCVQVPTQPPPFCPPAWLQIWFCVWLCSQSRLSQEVTRVDAEIAMDLINFAYYNEAKPLQRPKKKRHPDFDESGSEGDDDDDDHNDNDRGDGSASQSQGQRKSRSPRKKAAPPASSPAAAHGSAEAPAAAFSKARKTPASQVRCC